MNGDGGKGAPEEPVTPLGSIEQRLSQAMAELEATQQAVAEAEAELRHATCTVRSKDRAVEVTVGHQGELTALRFLDGKYRTMTAGELAAGVLEAAERARTRMYRQVRETFEPFTRPSDAVPEMTGMDVDWAAIFGPGETEHTAPTLSRNRLRDEIHEDAEDEHDA